MKNSLLVLISLFLLFGCNQVEKQYYPSGNLKSKIQYKNNKINGYYKIFYKNGNLKESFFYKNDTLEGLGKENFENGQTKWEANYINGKTDGIYYEYNEKGLLITKANFKNGKQEGLTYYYHSNGEIERKIEYNNGTQNGDFFSYDSNGRLLMFAIQTNNKPKYYEEYDSLGNLIDLGRVIDFSFVKDTVNVGNDIEVNIDIYGPFNEQTAKVVAIWVFDNYPMKKEQFEISENTYVYRTKINTEGKAVLTLNLNMDNNNYRTDYLKEIILSDNNN